MAQRREVRDSFVDLAALKQDNPAVFTQHAEDLSETAASKEGQAREVARAPGYFRPDDFLAMFRFVREKAYETKSLRDYLKSRAS